MRKVAYFILTIVELILLVGAYLIHYFTKKKMGMARYVIYKNKFWEREYPIEIWKTCALSLIAILTVLVVLLYLRKGFLTKLTSIIICTMIVTTALYTMYTTLGSTSSMRAYYFISPILAIVAVLQIIKAYVVILHNVPNKM